jgi:cell division protein FtsB
LLLQARLWVSAEGMREVWRLQDQVLERTDENRALAVRNGVLQAEVRDLKQGLDAVEERARVELGMIAPGETFFQITPQPVTQAVNRPR